MLPTGRDGRSGLAAGSSAPSAAPPDQPASTSNAASACLRIERLAREVFLAARTRDHVVLDANAAEMPELFDALPFDHLADGFRLRLVEQLVDDVEPGFHRDH